MYISLLSAAKSFLFKVLTHYYQDFFCSLLLNKRSVRDKVYVAPTAVTAELMELNVFWRKVILLRSS